MQDETTPPVPIKDVPIQGAPPQVPVAAPAEQLATPPTAAPSEVPKDQPTVKAEAVPVKEQDSPKPKRASAGPIIPVIFSIIVFVALVVCAYFVFKGM